MIPISEAKFPFSFISNDTMKLNSPIVFWLSGIVTLTILLFVIGGFQRELMPVVVSVFIATLLFGFFLFRRGRKSDARPENKRINNQ